MMFKILNYFILLLFMFQKYFKDFIKFPNQYISDFLKIDLKKDIYHTMGYFSLLVQDNG